MKLVITEPAKLHLKNLHDYYKLQASSLVANKIRKGILEKLRFIQKQPFVGQREEYLSHLNLNHRKFIEGNYKIIYRVVDETIFLLQIFLMLAKIRTR
jgi:plasmid stabilization system protein ParE